MTNESILDSVKLSLGILPEVVAFDNDLILHINSIFSVLTQQGIGPNEGFSIKDKTANWTDFLTNDDRLQAVKSYMNLRVKILFDPPASATVMGAYKEQIKELEWRMYIVKENDRYNEQNKK